MRTALILSLVLPLSLACAGVARADDPSVARAKERFGRAAQAYREARYRDAIDLFLQANQLDPHPELIFNVAQAYEKLNDAPAALRSFREYLRLSPGATNRATAEASIKRFEARLAERSVQQVTVLSTPAGAEVFIDGRRMGQTPCTFEIAPGRHTAAIKSLGYADSAREFQLAPDRAMDLEIALSRPAGDTPKHAPSTAAPAPAHAAAPLAPVAAPAAPPDRPAPAPARVAPWTIAALSVGVAGFGGAIAFEAARKSAETAAKNDPTQVGYQDKLDTMRSRQTAARVLVSIGSIAAAAGGVLLYFDLRGRGGAPARAAIGCAGDACGGFVSGRF